MILFYGCDLRGVEAVEVAKAHESVGDLPATAEIAMMALVGFSRHWDLGGFLFST